MDRPLQQNDDLCPQRALIRRGFLLKLLIELVGDVSDV
jgi:hypothetical protein